MRGRLVAAIISDEEELVRWLLLLMCLSGGDEKMRQIGSLCAWALLPIRRGRVGVDVDVTKWLWAVCGC